MKTLLVFLCLTSPVAAEMICVEKATDKLLEYQSDAVSGTCVQNWVAANPQYGYTAADIEERVLTHKEWLTLREAAIDAPAREERATNTQARQQKATALKTKLGLSDQEFKDLREALR